MKQYVKGAMHALNFGVFLLAMWVGLHDQDYAHAAFLMTLVILNEVNIK